MPVLGDVFAAVEVLNPPQRLRLTAAVAMPGRTRPILPRQLEEALLPVDLDALAAVRGAIEDGLDRFALTALAATRLDGVVPALAGCDPHALADSVPLRLRALLAAHTGGRPLAEFTIGEISGWSGLGPKRVALLISVAVAAALELLGRADGRLAFLELALTATGDERDRGVFENDVLALGPPVARAELALALGISVDRVRRLAARATQRVAAAVHESPPAIRQLAATAAERLGAIAPLDAVDEMLSAMNVPALPDTRSRLLLWMAGPYRVVEQWPGWVALDPAVIIAETTQLIHEDGGVRPLEHLVAELRMLGVNSEHAEDWLACQQARVTHGLVIATSGSPGDVAERALQAQGRAMSADELGELLPGGRDAAMALWSAVDRRFLLTATDSLALVEWGDLPDVALA